MQPTEQEIRDLKAAHGALRMLTAEGNSVVVRRASEAEWEVFLGYSADDKKRIGAMRVLLDKVVVWPAPEAFASMVKAAPGLVQTFASQATEFSGFVEAKQVEKKDL